MGFSGNRILLLMAVYGCCAVLASDALAASWRWQGVDRIVVFADVHGAYDTLTKLLTAAEVLGADGHWSGGEAHLVSLGDILDRGPDSRKVLDLLRRLQTEALAAGGYLHLVLGNHELMNMTGDLRYVSAAEWQAFEGPDDDQRRARYAERAVAGGNATQPPATTTDHPAGFFGLKAAFAHGGTYGDWLVQQPAVITINDMAFAHGGLSTDIVTYGGLALNKTLADELPQLIALGQRLIERGTVPVDADFLQVAALLPDDGELDAEVLEFKALAANPIYNDRGPFWYRGNSLCHPQLESDGLTATLANLGVERLAVGHSPTRSLKPTTRLQGRVVMLDTGMLSSYYGGKGHALVIDGEVEYIVDEDGKRSEAIVSGPLVNPTGVTDALLEDILTKATIEPLDRKSSLYQLEHEGRRLRARFVPGAGRANGLEIAAYRLDRLLGLEMVPVTVARKVRGKNGVLIPEGSNWISEKTRIATNQVPANWCVNGHAYSLIAAFDNLTYNVGRNTETVWHDPATWRIRLTHNHQGFGTTVRLAPLDPPPGLPESLRRSLAALNREALEPFLSKRQVRALLERRDMILHDWPKLEEAP